MNISHHEKRSKIAFLTLINVRAVSAGVNYLSNTLWDYMNFMTSSVVLQLYLCG